MTLILVCHLMNGTSIGYLSNMKKLACCFLWMLLLLACSAFIPQGGQENQFVQLVLNGDDTISANLMGDLLNKAKNGGRLYQWKNRLLFYGKEEEATAFYEQCKIRLPKVEVTLVREPFYVFDRTRCINGKEDEGKRDHIILSANLVADSVKQRSYLDYHRRQFDEWPEVSEGFCRAEFQQVLLFKTGRQLLLVIDIPEGADFEELNKRTVENNPKVDEWNHLMSTYQEGLPGTKAGEVWVRFRVMSDE
ncbi:L-rhamnose mutarotase [Olivibacter sp. XZL3]|uniref:L-rhamnose mutarotase n=1 Tax=Olivibacter sp. XZL3 TaxID=1735116 RepID=UPI001F0E00FD|nr:L-rhamnose mutarotase [Olivibacter sp. XZL3]